MKRALLCLLLLLCLCCTGCANSPEEALFRVAIEHALRTPEPTPIPDDFPVNAYEAFTLYQEELTFLAEYLWMHPDPFHALLSEGESHVTCSAEDADCLLFRSTLPEDFRQTLCAFLEARQIQLFGYERNLYGRAADVWFNLPCQDGYATLYYIRPDEGLTEQEQAEQLAETFQKAANNRHAQMEPLDALYWYLQRPLPREEGGILP